MHDETLAHDMKISSLKRRIARADYAVDADAVAAAFVRRLLARRTDAGGFGINRGDVRSPGGADASPQR